MIDAIPVSVADAPRTTEILMAIAICDGGRPVPRVGKERAVV
ncbi:MAG: amino acid synthesis family protein [Gammaproteobacteria bacterium]|nr:amino acid synthesis family protein [Gammaproteobacteria bacterium]